MSTGQDPFGREHRTGRLSDEETAQRMLDTAIERVNRDGLPVSFDALRFEEVIADAAVARSAAYRRWPTKQHFYADLLLHLAGFAHPVVGAFDARTIEVSIRGVLEHASQLGSPAGRRAVVIEMMRVGALQNFETLITTRSWSVYVTLLATLGSLPDNDFRAELQDALRGSEEHFVVKMAEFYEVILQVVGYRIRPELHGIDAKTVAQLGAAIVEGLTLGNSADPEIGNERLLLDPFHTGKTADWSLPSLGFASIALTMIEPDPGSDGQWSETDIDERTAILHGFKASLGSPTSGPGGHLR